MIRPCPSCGRENRVPAKRLAETGRCGSCKEALPPAGEPLEVGPDGFDEIVAGAQVPVLVDFWAPWCGPCRMAAPEVKRVAGDMAGKAIVLKVDTDQHPELAARFDVRGIPSFVVLKDGEVVKQQPGLVGHGQMQSWLEQASG